MLKDEHEDPVAARIEDAIELDEFFAEEPVVAPAQELERAVENHDHRDQYVHYTHELPEGGAEAASRILVRIVPLAYGAMLGFIADSLTLGVVLGVALGVAFDLYMGDNSMVRALLRQVSARVCPAVAGIAHALAAAARRLGIRAPAALDRMRCGV